MQYLKPKVKKLEAAINFTLFLKKYNFFVFLALLQFS